MPFSAKKVERVTETNEFALHHNSVNNKFSQRNQNKMAKPSLVNCNLAQLQERNCQQQPKSQVDNATSASGGLGSSPWPMIETLPQGGGTGKGSFWRASWCGNMIKIIIVER